MLKPSIASPISYKAITMAASAQLPRSTAPATATAIRVVMLKTPRMRLSSPLRIVPKPARKMAAKAGTAIAPVCHASGTGMTPRSMNSATKARTSAVPSRPQGSFASGASAASFTCRIFARQPAAVRRFKSASDCAASVTTATDFCRRSTAASSPSTFKTAVTSFSVLRFSITKTVSASPLASESTSAGMPIALKVARIPVRSAPASFNSSVTTRFIVSQAICRMASCPFKASSISRTSTGQSIAST